MGVRWTSVGMSNGELTKCQRRFHVELMGKDMGEIMDIKDPYDTHRKPMGNHRKAIKKVHIKAVEKAQPYLPIDFRYGLR